MTSWNVNVLRRRQHFLGDRIGHADIAVAGVLRFDREAHEQLFDGRRHPALLAHANACEALPLKEDNLSLPKG